MFKLLSNLLLKKSDNTLIHLLRSMASGSSSGLLDFLTMILLVEVFHFHYIIGGITGLIAGTTANYFISVNWIFNSRRVENIKLEYLIFIILGLVGGVFNILLLWFFTDKLEIFYMFSRIIAGILVFFFNFMARKMILFSTINV